MTTLRLAVWSGPRNISTAMMRAWENRPDTTVIDEPLYAHYLDVTGIAHPMAERIMRTQSTDWKTVAKALTDEPAASNIQYQKHISTHLLPEMTLDWCLQLTNCMLIRQPERMVASYAKKRADINARDFGYAEQLQLFEYLCANGQQPLVIDTDRLLQNPQAQLSTWCERLGIEFVPEMLSWPSGRRDTDGIWGAHWYDAVEKSTGFIPYQPMTNPLSEPLQQIADDCGNAYNTLLEYAI